MTFYRQCKLVSGNAHTTAWIKEKGAVVGKFIHLDDSDEPERVWKVETVSDVRLEQSVMQEVARESVKFGSSGSLNGMRGNK